jgi:anti-sigma-K factor RskA
VSEEHDEQLLAILYASGELEAEEAAAFERRLADDQSTRDALCTAVRLSRTMSGQPDPVPDVSYRERVKQRLLAGKDRPVLARRTIRVHPFGRWPARPPPRLSS